MRMFAITSISDAHSTWNTYAMKNQNSYIAFVLLFLMLGLNACSGSRKAQTRKYAPPSQRGGKTYGYNKKDPYSKPSYPKKEQPAAKAPASTSNKPVRMYPQPTPPKPVDPAVSEDDFPNIEEGLSPYEVYSDKRHRSYLVRVWEDDFKNGSHEAGRRPFKLRPFKTKVPGENLNLDVIIAKPASGYSGYYGQERFAKKRIVLHFTVGNLKSDIDVLTRPRKGRREWKMSVPFVIARDGTIYQLFGSAYWSYHLGKGTIGGNELSSRHSIGIEMSNYGPLIRVGDNLETVYSRKHHPDSVDVYCTVNDTHLYEKLPKPFRGYQYFATFTDKQYESLVILVRYLTAKYNIPRNFLPEWQRFQATEKTAYHRGITSHLNFRATGKWDIGPAFDWDRVIAGVQSAYYAPQPPTRPPVPRPKPQHPTDRPKSGIIDNNSIRFYVPEE